MNNKPPDVFKTSGGLSISYSLILPSAVTVTTCQGRNLPLAIMALLAAFSIPPQQGTSMRTMVTDLISLLAIIALSFSA